MDVAKRTKEARSNLRGYTWSGIVLSVIGGVIMGLAWPHTTVGAFGGSEDHGSGFGVAFGAAIAWAGNLMLLVGVIGYGVWFGREAGPLIDED